MKPLLQVNLDRLDFISWAVVIGFFSLAAVVFGGNLEKTVIGAGAIIILMLAISHSIELILAALSKNPRIGEFTGYITNGPEALCTFVGLANGKLLFAAGVPLGSNFANPILLILAGLVTGRLFQMVKTGRGRTVTFFLLTMLLAGSFYLLIDYLWVWVTFTLAGTVLCYRNKGLEDEGDDDGPEALPMIYIIPAALILAGAGYFLDPAVTFTAANSRVPEGVIGFAVLSFISSWPEFRSAISLLRMNRSQSAVVNIFISNITNLWLGVAAALAFLLLAS